MKICKAHWQMMRDAVDARGMMGLVAKSGDAAMEDQVQQLEEAQATGSVSEQTTRDTFDPLMSMHWHWMNGALRNGGLYLMGQNDAPDAEDRHYCPVCEYAKNVRDFSAEKEIGSVADQMREYCVEQELLAKPS